MPEAIQEKTCPRCAEQMKAAAVVCRFCGHEFEKLEQPTRPVTALPPLSVPSAKVGGEKKYAYLAGAIVGVRETRALAKHRSKRLLPGRSYGLCEVSKVVEFSGLVERTKAAKAREAGDLFGKSLTEMTRAELESGVA